MTCPNCQNEVQPGMKFCGECGTVLPAEPVAEPVVEVAAEPVAEAAVLAEEVEITTVYCPKCAQVNRVGDRFCMKCGCNLEGVAPSAVAPVVPAAEKSINMDKVEEFAKKSAKQAEELAKKGAKEAQKLAKKGAEGAKKLAEEGTEKAKKLPKPVLFAGIGVAAVVVIVLVILLLSAVFGGGSSDNFMFYLKDMEIYYTDFSKDDPLEITSRLADTGDVDAYEMADASYMLSAYMALTKDGNRLFYPDKVGDGYGVTLFYRELNKPKKDPQKVDSDIVQYAVSADGKQIVYLKGDDGDLYRSDLKEKEKLASNVMYFSITEDLKTILYLNDEYTLYLLKDGKDKEKIVSDLENLEYITEDLSTVYYTKDGNLYVQKIGEDRVKIGEDVEYVAQILDSGEVYYTTSEIREICMMDFVDDDLAASDEAMTEPVYPEYPEYPYSWEYESDEEYEAAYAAYEEALAEYERLEEEYWELCDLYWAKEDRDWLREDLRNYTEEVTDYTLHYFDGEESVEVLTNMSNGWVDDYAYDAAVVAASAYEEGEGVMVKLSEIESVWDVSDKVYEARYASAQKYIVIGVNAVPVEMDEVRSMRLSNDGKYLTYLSDMDEDDIEGDLYQVEIKKDSLGEEKQLDSDVYYGYVSYLDDGRIVYYKNVDDYEEKGDLFIDGVEVDYDVRMYSVSNSEAMGGVLYYTDWNDSKEYGTLKLYKGKKSEKLADDVHDYSITDAGELVYLYDYSTNYYTGSLYIYTGGKAKMIDEDVIALLPDAGMYQVMHGYNYYW